MITVQTVKMWQNQDTKLYMPVEVKSTYCPGKSYLTEIKQYICWRPVARKKLKGKVDKTLYFIKSLAT